MLPYDDLTQEEMDPQNEAIVTFLRHAYTGSVEAPPLKQIQEQAVANVLARFQDQSQTASDSSILPDAPEEEQALWSAGSGLQLSPRPRKRRFVSRLTSLVAAALLIVLVSSLVAVFSIEKHAQNTGVTADPHQKTIFAVSSSGTVFAIDGKDGAVLWQNHIGAAHSITLVNGAIYAGSSAGGAYIYALQPRDGSIIWRVDLEPDETPDILVVNGVVYATTWNFTGGKGHVYALNAVNGTILWHKQFQEGEILIDSVVNNIMYVSAVGNGITGTADFYALNAKNGSQLWHMSLPAPNFSVGILNGIAYMFMEQGHLYAFDASSGAPLWNKDTQVSGPGEITGFHDMLYVSGDNGYLYALRAQDGAQQWKVHVGSQGPYSPLLVNNIVYAQSFYDSTIYALNARDGQSLWSYSTPDRVAFAPFIVVDGVLYSVRWIDSLYALNASNGRLLAHYALPPDTYLEEVTSIAVEP